jgi:hypothetical protein
VGQATHRLVELVSTGNFDDETKGVSDVYASIDRGSLNEQKVDVLERACVRLMEALYKCRNEPWRV